VRSTGVRPALDHRSPFGGPPAGGDPKNAERERRANAGRMPVERIQPAFDLCLTIGAARRFWGPLGTPSNTQREWQSDAWRTPDERARLACDRRSTLCVFGAHPGNPKIIERERPCEKHRCATPPRTSHPFPCGVRETTLSYGPPPLLAPVPLRTTHPHSPFVAHVSSMKWGVSWQGDKRRAGERT
jgi:hypothetical protein